MTLPSEPAVLDLILHQNQVSDVEKGLIAK